MFIIYLEGVQYHQRRPSCSCYPCQGFAESIMHRLAAESNRTNASPSLSWSDSCTSIVNNVDASGIKIIRNPSSKSTISI